MRRSVKLSIFLVVLLVPLAARGDKLADFKTAAGEKGCGAIPYGSERGSCKGFAGQVEKNCKTTSMSCDALGTKGLIAKIAEMKKAAASFESKGDKAKADELKKKITPLEADLAAKRKEIDERIPVVTACLTSRKSVRTLFANVKSKVKGESDKALEPYADKLVTEYESQEKGHDTAIKSYEDALEICKKSKAGTR